MKLSKFLLLCEVWLTFAWVDAQVSFFPYRFWRMELIDGLKNKATAEKTPTELSSVSCISGHTELLHRDTIRPLIAVSESVARHHWRSMNCLRRCIAQRRLLKRRNIDTELHIGVAKKLGQLTAHSWISCDGRVINDSGDLGERYTELHALSGAQLGAMLK